GMAKFREDNTTDWWINNFRVAFSPTEKVRISLIGENVFNEFYSVRPGLLGAPNSATLRVDWRF
ncbi:MAG: hypothetical protein AAF840_09445, partial [Bacteroidota bacterium]